MCEKPPRAGVRRRYAAAAALGLVVGTTAGCSGVGEDRAEQAAADFYAALAESDGPAACELLAPATRTGLEQSSGSPCEEAILEEGLPAASQATRVAVYETAARVDSDADTAFLAEFPEGWKVVAAGCTPQAPEHPYDCVLTKG